MLMGAPYRPANAVVLVRGITRHRDQNILGHCIEKLVMRMMVISVRILRCETLDLIHEVCESLNEKWVSIKRPPILNSY